MQSANTDGRRAPVSPALGSCHRSQARAGEVILLLGTERPRHRHRLFHCLPSSPRILRGLHRVSFALVWGRTLLLEIRSLCFRIRGMHEKGLIDHYEMGLVCASCQKHGTQCRCKATRAYICCMQSLSTRLPWLSYSDSTLVREGWNLAFQSNLDSLECGIERDLEDDLSLGRLSGADSIPAPATQQSTKCDPSDPPPSRE